MPHVFIYHRLTCVTLLLNGSPLLDGLYNVHCLVRPHPVPLLAIGVFGADIGKTILYGLIVSVHTAAIAGSLSGALVSRYTHGTPSAELIEAIDDEHETQDLTSFSLALANVLLP
ncbi:GntP family permease, partial [Pseudomonas aeruginosa]|uniref:GntP family permease n=1 Tax=Pseudomonas aeruginosa TaxID=287 RepID=UPI002155A605